MKGSTFLKVFDQFESREFEADLASACKFDIDLCQQLGIEQGAVLDAVTAVDPIACAQGIERMLGAGMAPAGDRQRIDHPIRAHRLESAQGQLVIEKTEIELRIMRDQRRITEEIEKFGGLVRE